MWPGLQYELSLPLYRGHAFLQGIFLTHGLNPCLLCLLHWQAGSLPLAPPGTHHCNHSCVLALKNSKAESCSVVSDSLLPHGLYSPYNSPGQNTGVDSLSLLQGIFPTQGSNPCLLCLLHWQASSLLPVPPGKQGLVANFYSLKTKEIPAGRVALGDGCFYLTWGQGAGRFRSGGIMATVAVGLSQFWR